MAKIEMLTLAEAALELRCSQTTIRRWMQRGVLKAHRVGGIGRPLFSRADLRAALVEMVGDGKTPQDQISKRIDRIVREVRAQHAQRAR